jgi:hypothetical protein
MALLDIAEWRGPTANHNGAMGDYQGLVVHIADGYYDGTISWAKNGTSGMSCHFVAGKGGELAQVLDTSLQSWCQADGNARWLSVECVGFSGDALTTAQLETVARLLVELHRIHGIPLQLAGSPSESGLGHHSMGGAAWGGHDHCPGDAIIAQKPQIVARAKALVKGAGMSRADALIEALDGGFTTAADGEPCNLTIRRISDERWMGQVSSQLAAIQAAASKPAPVALTPEDRKVIVDEVSTQVLAGVESVVRRVLGSLDGK